MDGLQRGSLILQLCFEGREVIGQRCDLSGKRLLSRRLVSDERGEVGGRCDLDFLGIFILGTLGTRYR